MAKHRRPPGDPCPVCERTHFPWCEPEDKPPRNGPQIMVIDEHTVLVRNDPT